MARLPVLTALALVACAAAPLEITEARGGSEVRLSAGQELVVRLASNPTTGYRWQLREGEGGVVKPLGEAQYTRDSVPAGMVGSGGTETWRLAAARPGTQSLTFEYRRAWEQGVPAARTVSFRVTVN